MLLDSEAKKISRYCYTYENDYTSRSLYYGQTTLMSSNRFLIHWIDSSYYIFGGIYKGNSNNF